MTEYVTSDGTLVSEDALNRADAEIQKDIMEVWFRNNYEHPDERTPYVSSEGGYIWIWGGPYDAADVLDGEFSGVVPANVIEDLVSKLEGECWEWAPTPGPDDYDALIEDISQISKYYDNFSGAILDIEKLLEAEVHPAAQECLYRLLYVNVITALETYLSDAFISTVVNDPSFMRRFIETNPDFQSQKVTLAEVFKAAAEVHKKARAYLSDVVWHHIERVKPMYFSTLGISFPDDLKEIFQAVRIRHDIVHRNGRTKEGAEIVVTRDELQQLVYAVEVLVQHIDNQLAELKPTTDDNGSF